MSNTRESYEQPEVIDYGDLVDITAATGFSGPEDGGNKLVIHHSGALLP